MIQVLLKLGRLEAPNSNKYKIMQIIKSVMKKYN